MEIESLFILPFTPPLCIKSQLLGKEKNEFHFELNRGIQATPEVWENFDVEEAKM